MKGTLRVVILVAALALFVVDGSVLADNSLDGLWEGVPGSSVIISQDGNDIYLAVYAVIEGAVYVQHGQGKRTGNNVTFSMKTTSNVKNWPVTIDFKASVSDDGKKISGTNTNKLGTFPFTWTKKSR